MQELIIISRKYQRKMKKAKDNGSLTKDVFLPIVEGIKKELSEAGLKLTDNEYIRVANGDTDIVIDKALEGMKSDKK